VTTASASIPDLRPRKGLGKILLVGGVIAFAAAATIGIVYGAGADEDPAVKACDAIEKRAQERPEFWDKFVSALARTVEERAWRSVKPKQIEITGDTRYERCINSFEGIEDTVSYRTYEQIANCVAEAQTWRAGSQCFDKY
jgi:hypothetical protein